MDDKYYTPIIEEFYVGFEFEVFNSAKKYFIEGAELDTWNKQQMNFGVLGNTINLQRLILDKQIRVKYLNEQDILECGWSLWNKDGVYNILDKEERNWQMHIGSYDNRKDGAIALELYEGITANENGQQIVVYCKNKSDLHRLMKQLGIIS